MAEVCRSPVGVHLIMDATGMGVGRGCGGWARVVNGLPRMSGLCRPRPASHCRLVERPDANRLHAFGEDGELAGDRAPAVFEAELLVQGAGGRVAVPHDDPV